MSSRDHTNETHPHSINNANPIVQATEPNNTAQVPEIWIGYIKNRRNYLDKQPKAPNTEQQIRALQEYHQQLFTSTERFISRWIYCQKAIVQVGELSAVSPFIRLMMESYSILRHRKQAAPNVLEEQFFPHEVQFENLERWPALSAGLLRPETLRENGRFFHETSYFDVGTVDVAPKRKVLCVGHAVDKTYLVWPLAFSFCIAVVTAVVVGIVTRSVSLGTELGAFVGVATSLLWSYILWLLD